MLHFPHWHPPWHQLTKEHAPITDTQFIALELNHFKHSKRRRRMLDGERYYCGDHDILRRKRTVIGADGNLEPVRNLPNNRIVDNQYKKMVDQKCNYLLGQPLTVRTDNVPYAETLGRIMDRRFLRLMKSIGEDSLNAGIGWLFVTVGEDGMLQCQRRKPYEILAGWADADHTKLDYAVRTYEIIHYDGNTETVVEKVEVYTAAGIDFFERTNGTLIPVDPWHQDYFTVMDGNGTAGYNWSKIPLIPFKYNSKEIPLIQMVKSLQDGLNLIESNFQNQMEEDARNTILVLINYDGENLGEFRKNLATYGAVKVRTVDGAGGDLKTLQVEVNAGNYQIILELFKKAIIENAMGYDAKDDRLSGNPNQLNIQSMYSDIDLDANGMETEFQASFEELLWFINMHLCNTGQGDFEGVPAEVICNRDMLINEGEVIENCTKSSGMLSNETVVANHPWVDDVQAELDRIATQKEAEIAQYAFPQPNTQPNEPPDEVTA